MLLLNKEEAENIAIKGFQRLASDDDLLMRFCNITGILANEMRFAAQEPQFLVGVLEFFVAYEPDLLAWAKAENINPERIAAAHQALTIGQESNFE